MAQTELHADSALGTGTERSYLGPDVEIRVLGPLEVRNNGVGVRLGGRKQRTVLALLAAEVGKRVSVDALIDGVWGEEPTTAARSTLQTYVSNLRTAIGDVIVRDDGGYLLVADPAQVDAIDFEQAVARAADLVETDPAEASQRLRAALALWRGHPYADLPGSFALEVEAKRLEELRLRAVETRLEAELTLGRHADLIAELEVLCEEFPVHERFRAQHMLALYRCGRQAEALRAYQKTRTYLAEELGLEPSPQLQELERRILNQDASLLLEPEPQVQTLAFLLADIEDSTVLWELHTEAMRSAVADHDRIVMAAAEEAGGRLVKRVGDGVDLAFADVGAAVAAASEIQRGLADAAWDETGPLRVRMAVDVGEVEARGGDYFGPVLNRAGRLLAAAHAGQVLLSADAHAALAATQGGWQAKALGEFRFKGIGSPQKVFQLLLDGLPADFPPPRIDRLTTSTALRAFGRSVRGYELREQVGAGDFGVVYGAYQPSVGREVAIKVIRPELVNQPPFVRGFEAEAQLVAQLEHPHVVALYDYWRDPEGAYLVMRWLRGGSLRQALERGPWNLEPASRLLAQVGAALAYAHRHGVVHRDLKPANVLLDDEGNGYLSDFGIAARLADPEKPGRPAMSSPAYVPPEELSGQEHTPRSDIYGLGLLTFELLTGQPPPMDGSLPSLGAVRPELPGALGDVLACATASSPDERFESVDAFLAAFTAAAGGGPVAETYTPAENPYKGLQAFGETDAEDFYGRDSLVAELVAALGDHRLVAVVGPSGIGKSSVVKAGLVPALRKGALPGSERWVISDMFPGSYPFEELSAALLRVAVERPDNLVEELAGDELGMRRVVKRILPPGSELLLVIDQFEELFTLTADEETRRRVLDGLTALAGDPRSQVRVVITLRADFLDHPLRYPEFGELLRAGMLAVAAPSEDELAEAIERPPSRVGVRFAPGLVSQIVADVRDQPGALPLLQYALTELFAARTSDLLTLDAYLATGGVVGALGRRAEELYQRLDTRAQAACRQVFLRLVTVDPAAQDTRRRVRRRELRQLELHADALDEILTRYGEHRLLSFDREPLTRAPTVEVAHEALLTQWDRLRSWIEERREDLLLHRRLAEAVEEWQSAERDPQFLPREGRLVQFEGLASATDLALTGLEREFIDASRRQSERELLREQRANRRLRVLLAGAAILLVAAVAAGVVALLQRQSAKHQATVALGRQLGAQAVSEPRIDRAMLLAREAVKLDDSRQTESTLLTTLLRNPSAIATFSSPITDRPQSIALSPDGRTLVTVENTNFARFYDTRTRRERHAPLPNMFPVAPAYSRDGKLLLLLRSPAADKPPAVDVRDGQTLRHLRFLTPTKHWLLNQTSFENPLFVSPDGRRAYMAYSLVNRNHSDGPAFLESWNIQSGKFVGTTRLGSNGMFGGRVSGTKLFILTDTELLAGDGNNWRPLKSSRADLPEGTSTNRLNFHDLATVSPRGDVILFATRTGAVSFVNVRSGRVQVGAGKTGSAVQAADFSPRGDVAVTTDENGHVTVWNPRTAKVVATFTGHEDRTLGIAFSADGKTFFTCSLDGAIFEWDLSGKRRFGRPFQIPVDLRVVQDQSLPPLPPLALSPDGARFATRTGARTIGIFSIDTLRRLRSFSVDLDGPITAVAWSPAGDDLAVIGGQGGVQLWNIAGRARLLRSLHGLGPVTKEPETMQAVAFSPDGALVSVIAASNAPPGPALGNGLVGVWRVSSGRLVWKRVHHARPAHSLAFSREGKLLAVGFEVGLTLTVQRGMDQLVDPKTGGVKRVLHPIGYSQSLAFAPDGTLATGAWSGIVERWDVSSGKRLGHPVLALPEQVAAISFTRSGAEFATAGGSSGLKLWDTKTLQEVGISFPGSPGSWANAAVTSDGSKLLALYQDGRGVVWPATVKAWEAHACRVAGRNFTREEWSRFGTGRSYGKTCG